MKSLLTYLVVFGAMILPILIPLIVVVVGTVFTTTQYIRRTSRTGRVLTVLCGILVTTVALFPALFLSGQLLVAALKQRGHSRRVESTQSVEQSPAGAVLKAAPEE